MAEKSLVCSKESCSECNGCDYNELKEGDVFHLGDKAIQYTVVMHDGELMGKCIGCYGSYVGLNYWADRIQIVKGGRVDG